MSPSARRPRHLAAGCIVGLVVLATGAAEAESQGARSVRIDYEAPGSCPDEGAFEAQLRARSSKIVVASDGATSVRVRIAQRGARFEGEVALVDPKGRESHRRVEGGCSDVTAALALITALALDPAASTASDPSAPTATTASTAPPAATSLPTALPPAPPPPPAVVKPVEALPASDSAPLREDQARTHAWGWSIGAEAGLTQGVAPSGLVSVPAFLDAWRRSSSLFAPSIRVRFEHADSGTVSVPGGGADFAWTAASLDLCPLGWSLWLLKLSPCARGEGGVLSATGANVAPVRSDARPWVTVGLVARARMTVIGSLFLEIEGGGFLPLVRDTFFVEPDSTVQHAPVVAAAGAAGGGVTFW